MKRKLRVYYAPAAEGLYSYSYMVAAPTQTQALKLMRLSLRHYQFMGGFVCPESSANAQIARMHPSKVMRKQIVSTGFSEWEIVK